MHYPCIISNYANYKFCICTIYLLCSYFVVYIVARDLELLCKLCSFIEGYSRICPR
jgi:hypothetical protein